MLAIIIILIVLILLYLLSLSGRKNHPGLPTLRRFSYAHRGLHGNGLPENSMAAFEAALAGGYGIELDIHLLSDGNLAVIHDSSLKRTTSCEGFIEDLTTQDLKNYNLENTDQTIPEFTQVLELFAGKAPLIVELKAANNNHAALCEAACKLLDQYEGPFCVESFDPRCVLWLKKHRPDIIRGQLVEDFTRIESTVPWILRFCLTHQLFNFLLRPDFVAHKFSERKLLSNLLVRKLWGVQSVAWTIRSPEDFQTALSEDYLPIFEFFRP